jgi:hypothetical protein
MYISRRGTLEKIGSGHFGHRSATIAIRRVFRGGPLNDTQMAWLGYRDTKFPRAHEDTLL